jgi:archaellum component FlaC
MASFVRSVLRLISNRGPTTARPDEEQATTTAESVFGSSTLPPSHIHTASNRIPADDALTLFRLTLGITSAPHLGFSLSPHRPADNVGLYARVVRNEQTAKDSYKVFSIIINACYFLQIIVAASLTALGAANANNKAITAFGAINTVIAGFLTYLKGSGYPARFKYCAGEWKKVREFVEHRERDFSLESCTLDVHEEINTVREMYESTKRDVEMNNPEAYNAAKSSRDIKYDGVDKSKADAIANKLHGLDDTLRKLTGQATSAAGGVQEKSGDMALKVRSLEDSLARMSKQMEKTAEDSRDAAQSAVHSAVDDVEKRALAEVRGLGKAAVRGVEEYRPRAPREVSITVANRDDDVPGSEIEIAGKK